MKRTAIRRLYLIDGVSVPRKVYYRRQIFGEYAGAKFEIVEQRDNSSRAKA